MKNSQWSCKAKRYFLPAEIYMRNPPSKWKIFYSFYEINKMIFALLPLQPNNFFTIKYIE